MVPKGNAIQHEGFRARNIPSGLMMRHETKGKILPIAFL